ncbi:hypothetical protein EC9_31500 [Rosistilla ulvae]|uniref:Alpha/beta hydrolase family protein n=1 Tax=Rosistilla ulvae TaxID=1930277 RepID=A0A517M245_9BACT|nr:hypothetical protein [Rosistilla ulvae]QDS88954.1 hypothetical protein EC9_31500 [Rosistilla ulvae]
MKSFAPLLLVLAAMEGISLSQNAPYDMPPTVEPPYYRVRYAASSQPAELSYPVAYTVWMPPGVEKLRGVIVHQHGCGEGSCKSGQTGAFDLHWQALAQKHRCALLSPAYEQPAGTDCQMWCDPRNGSDNAFQTALTDLGELSGHPELAEVPWALWGHSGGGHWAGGMLMLHPNRIAAVWLRSGVPLFEAVEGRNIKPHTLPDAALTVPTMCNFGTKEGYTDKESRFKGVWPSNETFFKAMRSRGALLGIAIDPLTSHECGNSRYLAIPWLDTCLSERLPETNGQPLRPMPQSTAMLAPLPVDEAAFTAAVPAAEYKGVLATSIWLPNEAIATAWKQFITDSNVADVTPPPAPTDVQIVGDQLTWNAAADLESGIGHFIIERDGKTLATVPEKPLNRFGRPLFQGLQYSDTPTVPLATMRWTIDKLKPGETNPYRVRSVNTAGLISP